MPLQDDRRARGGALRPVARAGEHEAIRSGLGKRAADAEDVADYQTIYAARDGAVAAPTAGLHFTEDLMTRLDRAGVERAIVTLHVGAGTFLPVKTEDTAAHKMHAEWREIPAATATAVNPGSA